MSWRYCVTRTTTHEGYWYAIREVYFDEDGTCLSWTADGVAASGENLSEVRWDLDRMVEALGQQVLDISADPPAWIEP